MNPIELVKRYLGASEARRLDEAQSYLADDAEIIFPGGHYTSLHEMATATTGRYRWVKKVYQEWDLAPRTDGTVVVINTGTLYGENIYGQPFEGIRYIDRFVIRNGKILNQQV